MSTSKTAVPYLRVSTDDQALGLEAQRAQIQAWATREGISLVSECVDSATSGGTEAEARPGLTEAIGQVLAKRAGILVVAKRDRLARDVRIASQVEYVVAKAKGRIVSADGSGNGDTPADGFMRTVIDGAAAYERALIRSRTKAALAAKKAKGELVGAVPYGFQVQDGRLVPEPGEQVVFQEVHSLRASGRSLNGIVSDLASRGHTARSGKVFILTQVVRILRTQP